MPTEGCGKPQDGNFVGQLRGLDVAVRALNLIVETRQDAAVSLRVFRGKDFGTVTMVRTHEGAAAWCASSTMRAFRYRARNFSSLCARRRV